ncbi:MAG: hypothetical protein H7Z76_08795 [Methylotenera sp.]|nr:hypothetical protein [Flavobacterium sp.]
MKKAIIFSYKQYVGLYPELLNDFLLIDSDYEEIDFLDFELGNYRTFYANTIIDYKNDREYFDVENNVFIVDNCSYAVIPEISEYANNFKGSYDNEGYDLLAFKFKKIIEFLEQKKYIILSKSPSKISDFLDYNDEFENVKLNQNNESFAKEKIEFLVESLIDFSNKNEYDYKLYNSFALNCAKSFDRYFSQIENEIDKEKIISNLKTNFHFSLKDIVIGMLSKTEPLIKNFQPGATYYIAPPIPDTRIIGYENNYKHLIEYFFNEIYLGKQELEKESDIKVSIPKNLDETKLMLEEIALKLVWEGANVTRENAKDFLIETEYISGDKLYNHFKFYRNSNDRRSNPNKDEKSKIKLRNKITRFENVIKTLNDEFKGKAQNELKVLKSYLSDN